MTYPNGSEQRDNEITVHVFSISAGMVGVCLTAISIVKLLIGQAETETIADDVLAVDAVLFALCCFLSFAAMKLAQPRARRLMRLVVDGLFLVALTLMVGVCAIMVYALA